MTLRQLIQEFFKSQKEHEKCKKTKNSGRDR